MSEPPNGWERNYKARPISAEEWKTRYELFKKLYLDEDRNLSEVRWIMARDHGFYAKEVQCKKRISKWGLEKNVRKEHMKVMLRIQQKRALEGRKTAFKFKGRPVSEEKLARSRKRLKLREDLSTSEDIPDSVAYWTPENSSPEHSGEEDSEDSRDSPESFSDREGSLSPSENTQDGDSTSLASPLQDGSGSRNFETLGEFNFAGQVDQYESELKLYSQKLVESKNCFGEKHPNTLRTFNDMAAIYHCQGRYDKALELYQKALDGKEEVLGEDDPLTLHSVYNIALIFYRQERYEDALKFFWWALTGEKKFPGEKGPFQHVQLERETSLGAAINMTTIFYRLGNRKNAIYWCGRALDESMASGKEHPSNLKSVAIDIAKTLCEQARYEEPRNRGKDEKSEYGCPDAMDDRATLRQKLAMAIRNSTKKSTTPE